jgi:hypothetical protein
MSMSVSPSQNTGIEMPPTEMTEATLSQTVSRLTAERVPRMMPPTEANRIAVTASLRVFGNF